MISWNTWGNGAVLALAALYLALNPFPHVTAIEAGAFYLALFLFLVLLVTRGAGFAYRTPFTWILVLYVGWSCASIFWSQDRTASLHDFFTHLLNYVILFLMLVSIFSTEKRLTILVRTIVISTAVFSVAAIAWFYLMQGNPLSARLFPDRQIQPNMVGILTSFATLLSFSLLRGEKRPPAVTLIAICLAANLAATVLTYSRGALASLGIALVLLFVQSWKRLALAALAGVLVVSLMVSLSPGFRARLAPERIMQDGRVKIIFTALEVIKAHPLTGVGFGMETFKKEWTTYNSRLPKQLRGKPFSHTHNFILDVAVRLGIVGLALFFCIIAISLKTSWSLWRTGRSAFVRDWSHAFLAAFAALLAAGMTGNIMNNHKSAVLFYVCLAFTSIVHGLDAAAGKDAALPAAAGAESVSGSSG